MTEPGASRSIWPGGSGSAPPATATGFCTAFRPGYGLLMTVISPASGELAPLP